MQDGIGDRGGSFSVERAAAAGHFIQNSSEAENIRARVYDFAACFLGRHVRDGAYGCSVRSERAFIHGGKGRRLGVGDEFGEAEIQNFDLPARGQENILGLMSRWMTP